MPCSATPDGLRLTVRLTPRGGRGGRDGLDGIAALADGRRVLKVRVRAAPSEGEANAALVAFIAGVVKLPRSCVALVAGQSARVKTLALVGDPAALMARLESCLRTG